MNRPRARKLPLLLGLLVLLALGSCRASTPPAPEAQARPPAGEQVGPQVGDLPTGRFVRGNDPRLVPPVIEDDRRVYVALIAVDALDALDRPGAVAQVTRLPGPNGAAFIEVTDAASAIEVRRAFTTLGMMMARYPEPIQGMLRSWVEPLGSVPVRYDDDPFFVHTSRALEAVRTLEQPRTVAGYGEARAVVVVGRISELVGSARILEGAGPSHEGGADRSSFR
jgi:hypothetical protein